ncbi:aspartate-semialdehyde dehydrogenase [Rickettsiales endosymbiont of Stachyamoeba lipophora]|uniref:aspartate-semialdehyde dehydrogenase n=1 Tax=Rickettsiales endosymbiont of Stachyamoeba lipophora TaxID=2486578 RepID=UPI000F6471F2|nr:aspartate-semialdehyde dehydrogenase [Rickettsiales endosymbiont of Stachyamoeba lipophora]AZL15895.1 aspartate-semialdehyde dehydrogenase [Rickettsiales endosymbiont of Stachyamoeba lipophora]
MQKYNVAIVGATGAVGREMLALLSEREFPVEKVYAVASRRSAGKDVSFGEVEILKVESLEDFDFSKVDIALFSAGSNVSKNYAEKAAQAGCFVIDNSSAFRMEHNIPLIVPEVNLDALGNEKLIANPNCVVIPIVLALKPLMNLAKIKRIVISTYQSVSGAGKKAMDELFNQTKSTIMYQQAEHKIFEKQIAFNILAKIGDYLPNGATEEEQKIVEETRKVLGGNIKVTATCVRVPVFIGHSISLNVEFHDKIDLDKAKNALTTAPGVLVDEDDFTTPMEIVKSDEIMISRIRIDESVDYGLNMWIVGDNIRKGAALNAVQIAEELTRETE